jgi:hypothetical protein
MRQLPDDLVGQVYVEESRRLARLAARFVVAAPPPGAAFYYLDRASAC